MSARSGRTVPLVLAGVGALVLVVGLVVAFVSRDEASPVAAVATVLVGNALTLGATAWALRQERAPAGLAEPYPTRSLPAPAWWWPVAATGVVDVAAAPAAAGWLGLIGIALVAAALVAAGRALLAPTPEPDRQVVRAARRLRALAGDDEGRIVGALEPVGRSGVRVVAIGADGRWIDVMLTTAERAHAAADLAGVDVLEETEPAFSAAFARGPSAWSPLVGPRGSRRSGAPS